MNILIYCKIYNYIKLKDLYYYWIIMKKIIFIINYPTPYQIEFFDEMSKVCKLKIIFLERRLKNYNFKFSNRKYVKFPKSDKSSILKIIENFKPDFVILGGYKLNYTKKILKLCTNLNFKYLFWMEKIEFKNFIKKIIIKNYFRYFLKNSYGILAVGNEAKKFYSKFNKNTLNFHYSIKISNLKKKIFFKNNNINFLYVGQIIERKNILNLIKAFKKIYYKKMTLTIIGNGNLKEKAKKISNNINNIKIINFLNKDKLKKYFINSDIFILPSKYDGWGVVVMEAMSYKCAVISTKSSGVSREYIKNNFNGKISSYEINDLSKSIKYYLKNKNLIQKHAKRSRLKAVTTNINAKNSAKKLINFLEI